ncbi:MAG: hypothetical protein CBC13_05575 [Planctomycetia bacterium TMED53]|nr:MAG: hypothetical protein CBC13_05575 [Planctomycetia bacterium TMED53]
MQNGEQNNRFQGRLAGLVDPTDSQIVDENLAPLLRDFLEQYDAVLDELDDENVLRRLAGDLLATFNLFLDRQKDQILVRIISEKKSGRRSANTFIDVVCQDQPFVVDTIQLILEAHSLDVVSKHSASAPVIRDKEGRVQSIDGTDSAAVDEIICHFEIAQCSGEEVLNLLQKEVQSRLEKAFVIVRDYKQMKGVVHDSIRANRKSASKNAPPALLETRELLEWLLLDNFVFFGVERWSVNSSSANSLKLGIHSEEPLDKDLLDKACSELVSEDRPLGQLFSFKGFGESLVHRKGKIDHFLLLEEGDGGQDQFVHIWGLFTFKALQVPGDRIPFVRGKLDDVVSQHPFPRGGLRFKSYQTAFNSIPVEFLFEAGVSEIEGVIQAIHYVERSREIHGHMVMDEDRRKGLYFLITPREGYSEEQRAGIESILVESTGANYSDSRFHVGKHGTVLLSFFLTATEELLETEEDEIQEKVKLLTGTWSERFHRHLESMTEIESEDLFMRYRDAFPREYQILHSPDEAFLDISCLERVRGDSGPDVTFSLFRNEEDVSRNSARIRIYQRKNLLLSKTLPILDNFGVSIVDQISFKIRPNNGEVFTVDTFQVHGVYEDDHPLIRHKEEFLEALQAIFVNQSSSDGLDRLVIEAGLNYRDVDLIRNQLHYMHQLGLSTTVAFASTTLCQHSQITKKLLEYYSIRFDHRHGLDIESRKSRSLELYDEIQRGLIEVLSSAQDQFLRKIVEVFRATLRTTRYIEFDFALQVYKYQSALLPFGPQPRPWREIYVHHPEVEGVHLRGGPLARGGLRWSDRVTDFRTEVYGLQQTQMVKNVLIVPVGAKGGFILRKPATGRQERREQADRVYRTFIKGLLKVTDNVIEGEVVHPENMICWDGEDPYLVVAADKGTAHLSDTANEISEEHDFWLDDAFASGGKHGYDHKELAITAKGAWEEAKIHFRRLGLRYEEEPYSVVGIGDMSGDVFGNGMLLAEKGKLLAAFNHLHIFIDPNPDLEASYQERLRLFNLERSNWSDYNQDLISQGGGIFDRTQKTIDLPEVSRELLQLPPGDSFTPEQIIQAILKLPTDMIFNGGIGTYIRADSERDQDVGDPANSACRIPASAVKTRMIVEGGNLGVTPEGRIQVSRQGTLINADFVDNSGGVDCSDHEVNLKTLLAQEVRSGRLDFAGRNQQLEEVQSEVCELVLDNNREQGMLIGLDEIRSHLDPFSFERTISVLEDRDILNRSEQFLPTPEEIAKRHAEGQALTRPELAVIAAHAKMDVYRRLLKQPVGRIDEERLLFEYFPVAIREKFPDAICQHQLRREIAMTVVTNRVINRAGSSFFFDMERETGRSVGHVAQAYLVADDLVGAEEMRQAIYGLTNVEAEKADQALVRIEECLRRAAAWLLSTHDDDRLQRIQSLISEGVSPLEEYEESIPSCLAGPEQDRFQAYVDEAVLSGFPEELAYRLAKFEYLTAGVRILDVSNTFGLKVDHVARVYYLLGNESGLHPLVRKCDESILSGRWDSLSMRILRNTILDGLWALVARICESDPDSASPRWIEESIDNLRSRPSFRALESDIRRIGSEELSIASVQVLSVRFRRLVE